MVKLKQLRLLSYAIAVATVFFFSACVDKRYNLDDDNLDKSGVFSPNGGTVPIGSVEKIMLYEQIQKLFPEEQKENFRVDADGTIFLLYSDPFDVNFEMPALEVPPVDDIVFNAPGSIPDNIDGLPIPGPPYTITIPASSAITGDDLMPPYNNSEKYEIDLALHGDGWTVESIDSIGFKKCTIDITAGFTGITFPTPGNSLVKLKLTLPDNIILVNESDRTIEKSVLISDFNGGQLSLAQIAIAGYKNNPNAEITYSVELDLGNKGVTASSPDGNFSFDLTLTTGAAGIVPSQTKGKIAVKQSITGSVNNFNTFFESFGVENTLDFRNPALGIELITSNIGFKPNLNINLNNGVKTDVTLALNPVSKQTTQLWLAPNDEGFQPPYIFGKMDINNLLISRPETFNYELTLSNDENKDVVLSAEGMDIKGSYMLKLPFDFSNLVLVVSDTIHNVFTQDIYDGFFKKQTRPTDLKIESDSVEVRFSNPITLTVTANILDENGKSIPGASGSGILTKEENSENYTMEIKIQGLESGQMEKAKHLALSFSAKAKPLRLTDKDYIQIKKLKFTTNNGFHFDF